MVSCLSLWFFPLPPPPPSYFQIFHTLFSHISTLISIVLRNCLSLRFQLIFPLPFPLPFLPLSLSLCFCRCLPQFIQAAFPLFPRLEFTFLAQFRKRFSCAKLCLAAIFIGKISLPLSLATETGGSPSLRRDEAVGTSLSWECVCV